jgi:hypothetical protein
MNKRLFIILVKSKGVVKEHVVTARSYVLAVKGVLVNAGAYSTIVSVQDKGIVK